MAQSLTEQFKAFVASKPADETYDRVNPRACALRQFGWRGVSRFDCGPTGLPPAVYWAAVSDEPSTFGALLERLNALEAEAA